MGKAYAEWKAEEQTVREPDELDEAYRKVIEIFSPEQEEIITKYCDRIFSSGAETEEFFYRLWKKIKRHQLSIIMNETLNSLCWNDRLDFVKQLDKLEFMEE